MNKELKALLDDCLGFSDKVKIYCYSFAIYFTLTIIFMIAVFIIFSGSIVIEDVLVFIFGFFSIRLVTGAIVKKHGHENMIRIINNFEFNKKGVATLNESKKLSAIRTILKTIPPGIIWMVIMVSFNFVNLAGQNVLTVILSGLFGYYLYQIKVFNYKRQLFLTVIDDLIGKHESDTVKK